MKGRFPNNKGIEREGDDSSDEEDSGLELCEIILLLEQSWEKFQSEKLPRLLRTFRHLALSEAPSSGSLDLHEQYFRSSYILHFLGRALLNEKRVKSRYRKEKYQKIPKNVLKKYPDRTDLKKCIEKAILALSNDFEDEKLIARNGLLRKKLVQFIKENKLLIEKIIDDLFTKDRILLKILNRPNFLLQSSAFENLINQLKDEEWFNEQEFKSNKRFTPTKLNNLGEKDRLALNGCLMLTILDEITTLLLDDKDEDEKNDSIHMQKVLDYLNEKKQDKLSYFKRFLKDKLTKIEDKIELNNCSVRKFVEDYQEELLEVKRENILLEEKKPSSETILWQVLHYRSMPESVTKRIINKMPLTSDRINAHITFKVNRGDVQNLIATEIAKTLLIERDTLPNNYTFVNPDRLSFLANLSLSNRSQRRLIRNKKSVMGRQGDIHSVNWEIGKKIIDERQEIVPPSFSRRDEVDPLTGATSKTKVGSYKKIDENINAFKRGFSKHDDSMIARYLQLIHAGKLIKFEKAEDNIYGEFFTTLVYLLMGTESRRNPSAFFLHPMALELIAGQKITWQQAIAETEETEIKGKIIKKPIKYRGGRIPMTMRGGESQEDKNKSGEPGVVASARWLHKQYNGYMPKSYMYEGDEQPENEKGLKRILELIKREHELLVLWFKYNNKLLDNLSVSDIAKIILGSTFYEWYPEFVNTLHIFSPSATAPRQIFEEHAMPLDGNCLFHSLMRGYAHLSSQSDWKATNSTPKITNSHELRTAIVEFMSARFNSVEHKNEMIRRIMAVSATDQYRNYVEDIFDEQDLYYDEKGNLDLSSSGVEPIVERYLHLMAQDGTYGGDLEILIASELFEISIACYQYDHQHILKQTIIGHPSYARISILYQRDTAHYQLLLPYTGNSSLIQTESKVSKSSSLFKPNHLPIKILERDFDPLKIKSKNIFPALEEIVGEKGLIDLVKKGLKVAENKTIVISSLKKYRPEPAILPPKTPFTFLKNNKTFLSASSIGTYDEKTIQTYINKLSVKLDQPIPQLLPVDFEVIASVLKIQLIIHYTKNNTLHRLIYNNQDISLPKVDLFFDKDVYQGLQQKPSQILMRSIFQV